MSQTCNQLFYNAKPIYSLSSLALALGFEEALLIKLASNADNKYRLAKPVIKADGSIRQPFDALEPLKEIQKRIKNNLFSKVVFPNYLTGSIKGRDYETNASLHVGAKITICEDIENFFPATTSLLAFDIWRNFFGFSEEVAELLTKLTTKDSALPQGAITSSYLANLALWRHEPKLNQWLNQKGIIYSRYVDDITISSKQFLVDDQKTEVIAKIYGMLRKNGYHAKRRKHEISTSSKPMFITKLMVNNKVSLNSNERANICAAVYQLQQRVESGERGIKITHDFNSISGKVAKLKRFHTTKDEALMSRIMLLGIKLKKSNAIN